MEYAEFQGVIHIPRALEEFGFDGDLQLGSGLAKPVLSSLAEVGKPMKLDSAVGADFLWVEDEEAGSTLQPDEVEIRVEFVGIPASSSVVGEVTATSPSAAQEAVGVVVNCGDRVKTVSVGDQVVVFGTNTCKTRVRQKQSLVAPIPAGVLPDQVAALPHAFIAARYSLLNVAGLSSGQKVLVHDAASALGQAAVQVAKSAGAEVFALIAFKEQKEILTERLGIPPACIFDSGLQYFLGTIEQITNGQGVDVILNGGDHGSSVLASVNILGEFGFFLDLAITTSNTPEITLPAHKRNATLARIDIDRVQKAKPQVVQSLFQETFNAPLAPISPTAVFSVTDTSKAINWVSQNQYGKAVLAMKESSQVLTPPAPAKKLALDGKGTYVLAGGLGALGLDIASMMIDHGAKHLVFLSRSGGSKNEADLEGFRSRGIIAEAFKCDVNDADNLSQVFGKLKDEGRVIKGLIQCAMVLEDSIFDNMTHEKWVRAFMPKTRGSRNLLGQLSASDTPFFIMLSSITGVIGNTAQANYASGNTFEDALAHYARKHLNIAATSIDVGLVSDSSHFTSAGEFGDLENYLHKYQHGWNGLQCTLDELRIALRAVMNGSTADGQGIPSQMVLGLGDSLAREEGAVGFERDRKFDHRVVQSSTTAGGAVKGVSVGEKLAKATSLGEAATAVEDSLKTQVAAAIGVEIDEVDGQKPLPEFGVDSLKAVEMRNRALREMQSDISVFELLSATPLTDLAAKIASRSTLVKFEVEKTDV